MLLKAGEVAKVAKVSIRTLHHYDEIGLLVPSGRSDAGYRLYSHSDLEKLQQILFYRTLDFPLEEIQRLMSAPGFDRLQALRQQQQLLADKSRRLQRVLLLVEQTINELEQERPMELKAMFEAIPDLDPELISAGEAAWGHTDEHKESMRRARNYNKEDWLRMKADGAAINARLAALYQAGTAADTPEAIAAVEDARKLIEHWHFPCSRELHARITDMTSTDQRFIDTIDKDCPGLATWIRDAARANATR